MTRLAHFSDVHLTAKPLGWRPTDLLTKRVTGWYNLRLRGRGKSFRHAPQIVAALVTAIRERKPDGLVFSGDATGLGFESECAAASAALKVGDETLPPGVAVPGNHDYYTGRAARKGLFEKYFAPWQQGVRVEGHKYPFALKVGTVWLVCLNSSTHNLLPVDASGACGSGQLARLRELCGKLDAGPRVLVTHYPLRTARGEVEPRLHRLRDHAAALRAAADCGVGLWLHGHIHRPFVLPATAAVPFPVVCGGSTTQTNRWAYHEYAFDGGVVQAVRREYHLETGAFRDVEHFELRLPGTAK